MNPTPWYQRRTTWASLAGIAAAAAGLCIPNSRAQGICLFVAAVCGNAGSIFARSGALKDATQVPELPPSGELLPALDDLRKLARDAYELPPLPPGVTTRYPLPDESEEA